MDVLRPTHSFNPAYKSDCRVSNSQSEMCALRKTLRDTSSSFDFGSEAPDLNKHSFDPRQHRLSE